MQPSPKLSLRARGPLACFTRPELKAERFSYPVITPSAARGILEAVLWKPAITWRIERIIVLKEIRYAAFRRNEVKSKSGEPSADVIEHGGKVEHYFADVDRTQRNTVALRDVDYIIEGRFMMTEKAGPDDNMTKFVDMFERRVDKGQHWHQPYLGCREFVAEIMASDAAPPPIPDTRELGLMLWDISYSPKNNTPIFFNARLVNGVLEVPSTPEAAELSAAGNGGGS